MSYYCTELYTIRCTNGVQDDGHNDVGVQVSVQDGVQDGE